MSFAVHKVSWLWSPYLQLGYPCQSGLRMRSSARHDAENIIDGALVAGEWQYCGRPAVQVAWHSCGFSDSITSSECEGCKNFIDRLFALRLRRLCYSDSLKQLPRFSSRPTNFLASSGAWDSRPGMPLLMYAERHSAFGNHFFGFLIDFGPKLRTDETIFIFCSTKKKFQILMWGVYR